MSPLSWKFRDIGNGDGDSSQDVWRSKCKTCSFFVYISLKITKNKHEIFTIVHLKVYMRRLWHDLYPIVQTIGFGRSQMEFKMLCEGLGWAFYRVEA